jgi:hypothetical protein
MTRLSRRRMILLLPQPLPPSPVSKLDRRHTQEGWERERQLADGRKEEGWGWSQSIRQLRSLVLYNTLILSGMEKRFSSIQWNCPLCCPLWTPRHHSSLDRITSWPPFLPRKLYTRAVKAEKYHPTELYVFKEKPYLKLLFYTHGGILNHYRLQM